jgi:hypothetical protein
MAILNRERDFIFEDVVVLFDQKKQTKKGSAKRFPFFLKKNYEYLVWIPGHRIVF